MLWDFSIETPMQIIGFSIFCLMGLVATIEMVTRPQESR